MSILIASVLFLSGASPSPEPSPVPSPRKSAQATSQSSGTAGQKTHGHQTPSGQTSAIAYPTSTPEQQQKLRQIATSNKKKAQPIRIAPVDIHRDWLDYVNPILTFLLVIVGGIYAVLMARQLATMKGSLETDQRAHLNIEI
jgi:hypothetical protein